MVLNLQKGQKVDLTKGTNIKKIRVCLGWDEKKFDSGKDFDLDASAFLLKTDGKCESEKNVIFYNQLTDQYGAVTHSGDNRTGAGAGDKEIINIDFDKTPLSVAKIAFAITIYEAMIRKQNFGMVSNAYARVVDITTNQEILRYNLGEDFSTETAIVTCEVYRYGNDWKFAAVGQGFNGGLEAIVKGYGLPV